jgi:hypothetical protein
VRVILLAESHVYTTVSELGRKVILPVEGPPRDFVRLVYCLGYGENGLLDQPVLDPLNSGTPQFWKIFYSCLHRVVTNDDFAPVLGQTPFAERVGNKLALLQALKEAGVWLLDASLAALYIPRRPKPSPDMVGRCLLTSWSSYVRHLVIEARPAHIVVVGRGVAGHLSYQLSRLGVPLTVVPQPNARLSSTEHHETFQTCYEVVQRALQEPDLRT